MQKTDEKQIVSTNAVLLTICNEACSVEVDESNCWIDNGATKHLTNSSKYFVKFEAFVEPHNIKAAGQETLKAIEKGSIRIISTVDDKCEEITLTAMWYVKGISKNLSILAAQDLNSYSYKLGCVELVSEVEICLMHILNL